MAAIRIPRSRGIAQAQDALRSVTSIRKWAHIYFAGETGMLLRTPRDGAAVRATQVGARLAEAQARFRLAWRLTQTLCRAARRSPRPSISPERLHGSEALRFRPSGLT